MKGSRPIPQQEVNHSSSVNSLRHAESIEVKCGSLYWFEFLIQRGCDVLWPLLMRALISTWPRLLPEDDRSREAAFWDMNILVPEIDELSPVLVVLRQVTHLHLINK